MDLDKQFKSLCRIVLQGEIGELKDFTEFLSHYSEPIRKTKSAASGKDVFYAAPYCEKSKMISFEEGPGMKFEPLKPGEMKDIDLLLDAVGERFHYSGNKIGGNCSGIEECENIGDSVDVYESHDVYRSEHVAYSQMITDSKFMFGCSWDIKSSFCLNVSESSTLGRCFESGLLVNCNDCYFSYNLRNCGDSMFCFNQRSVRNCIGNAQLEKPKYLELKKKLLAEVVDELKRKKDIPSLTSLASGGLP